MTNAAPNVRVDPGSVIDRRGLGGSVFSTGLEPILIRIVPKRPGEATYLSRIYLVCKGRSRYLGTNRENKTVNLGTLPADELQILINDVVDPVSSTGPASRNADRLPHAIARDLADGLVEVRFEDSTGLPEERLTHGSAFEQEYARKNFFGDVILQLTGGVTADSTVPMLLESLHSDNADLRKAAAEALRQTHPRIARAAGLIGRTGQRR